MSSAPMCLVSSRRMCSARDCGPDEHLFGPFGCSDALLRGCGGGEVGSDACAPMPYYHAALYLCVSISAQLAAYRRSMARHLFEQVQTRATELVR